MQGDRFILDTNIWLSYIISARLAELTEIIIENNLNIYTSPILVEELSNNLQKQKIKKYLTYSSKEYLSQVQELSTLIKPEKIFRESIDPNDNFLFDLALNTKAHYLVTGDKILFETKIAGTRLITLREFRNMF